MIMTIIGIIMFIITIPLKTALLAAKAGVKVAQTQGKRIKDKKQENSNEQSNIDVKQEINNDRRGKHTRLGNILEKRRQERANKRHPKNLKEHLCRLKNITLKGLKIMIRSLRIFSLFFVVIGQIVLILLIISAMMLLSLTGIATAINGGSGTIGNNGSNIIVQPGNGNAQIGVDMSNMVDVAVAASNPAGYGEAVNNDGNELYQKLYEDSGLKEAGLENRSCASFVSMTIRATHTDDDWPKTAAVSDCWTYLVNSGQTKWKMVGLNLKESEMRPGDVLSWSNADATAKEGGSHIWFYVGNAAIKKKYPDIGRDDWNSVAASYEKHSHAASKSAYVGGYAYDSGDMNRYAVWRYVGNN